MLIGEHIESPVSDIVLYLKVPRAVAFFEKVKASLEEDCIGEAYGVCVVGE